MAVDFKTHSGSWLSESELTIPSLSYAGYDTNGRGKYLGWLLIATVAAVSTYYLTSHSAWERATKIGVALTLIISGAHLLHRFARRPINCLAPDFLFVIFYMAFHLGYAALWALDILPTAFTIFYFPSALAKTMLIVNIGLISFLAGYELGGPAQAQIRPVRKIPTVAWLIAGLIIMIIALAIHIGYIAVVGLNTWFAMGYQVAAHMDHYVSFYQLWGIQYQLFPLGTAIYFIAVALRYGKLFKGKLGLIVFGVYFFLLLMEGGRTWIVMSAMVLVLIKHYLIKPIKLRWLMVFGVCALMVFSSIKIVRNVAAFNISKMKEELSYARSSASTTWYDSIVEMGGSIQTVNMVTALIPENYPYWHGRSYLQALVHVIPFGQTYTARYLGAGPAEWLTVSQFGTEAAGTGFSIAAEGYLNFGLLGTVAQMFAMGLFLRWIYYRFVSIRSISSCLLFMIILGLFMISVRNHSIFLLLPIARIIVLSLILKTICGEEIVFLEKDPEYE